ncbi:MAG: glycosyltransferase [Betaproteobacteria bacterium]|nr:glycosyltransferase [Betaproteobacteria bacterium]
MNILLTTISLDSRLGGGTAERTRRLADHLRRQGHRCEVLAMQDGDLADTMRSQGIAVHVFRSYRLRFSIPLLRLSSLVRLVANADVIHVLGYWNLLSVATTLTATWLGKPYALSAAGEFIGLENPRPIARAFHRLFGQRMIRNAGLLIAITALERRQIMERFGLAADTVVVVPNGVEEPTTPQDAESQARRPVVLFVGRLAEVKGPDLLVEAFSSVAAEHPDVELVLAGPDFGMQSRLVSAIEAHGLSGRVRFTGHLGEDGRTEAYRRALLLVVPSRAEAMSLVALEAGILGTPVLLTDRCGFDEVAAIGGGEVVPASVEGLREGLRAMLARRASLPAAGERLRAYVMWNYAWPAIVKDLVKHFENLRVKPARRPRSGGRYQADEQDDSSAKRGAGTKG